MRFELTTPGLRDQCSATELKRRRYLSHLYLHLQYGGSVAEWSKALVLGTSPKGRGFESHRCQKTLSFYLFPCVQGKKKDVSQPAGFEPARGNPIGFQVQRLNHSATTADEAKGIEYF